MKLGLGEIGRIPSCLNYFATTIATSIVARLSIELKYQLLSFSFFRMALIPPSYCFVAFPPRTKEGLVIFGKNSARPRGEVQEVVYFAAATHDPGCKVEVNTVLLCQFNKEFSSDLICCILYDSHTGQYFKIICFSVRLVLSSSPSHLVMFISLSPVPLVST